MNLTLALSASRVIARQVATVAVQPRRTKAFIGDVLRYISGYSDERAPQSHLPLCWLDEIFPAIDSCEIRLRHRVEPKALPYAEAFVLASITASLKPARIFEIGTFTGGAALIMAQQAPPGAQIFTLDMPPGQPLRLQGLAADPPTTESARIGGRFRGRPYGDQIAQLHGDSATFDYSPYRGQIDLVFIDGSHSYEYVANDTERALEMLSPKGAIVWDDCSEDYPGVVTALDERAAVLPIVRIIGTRFAAFSRPTDPSPRHVAAVKASR